MIRRLMLAAALVAAAGYSWSSFRPVRQDPEVLVTAHSCDLLARIAVLAFEARDRGATREATRRLAIAHVTSVRVMERVGEAVDIGFESRSVADAWDRAMASCRSTAA